MRNDDATKLRTLADWFDKYDNDRGYLGERSVQADLRRIADSIDDAIDLAIERNDLLDRAC